jgi:type 1 glutamine amidotransferase
MFLLGGILCALMVPVNSAQSKVRTVVKPTPNAHSGHKSAEQKIKVMLLDGQSAGAYHNWRLTTPVLKKELEETGLFEVEVVTAPPSDGDFSNFNPDWSQYQVIVMNYDGPSWPEQLRTSFEKFVNAGGGLVVVHAADNAFPNWPAFNEMAGIGGWRNRNENAGPYWYFNEGKLVGDTSPGPAGMHGARLPYQVETRVPDHPIMKGLPPVWMHLPDELYGRLRGPGTNMTVLATAHSDKNNRGSGFEEPMLMVLRYGKGRVFHTVMGHDVFALSCTGFIATYQRGTEWAATGRVTQKVPADFPTARTVSSRVDINEMDPEMLKGASDPVRSGPFSSAK